MLSAAVSFGETIVLARYFSLTDFGTFVTMTSVADLINSLLEFRSGDAVIKFIPELRASKGILGTLAFFEAHFSAGCDSGACRLHDHRNLRSNDPWMGFPSGCIFSGASDYLSRICNSRHRRNCRGIFPDLWTLRSTSKALFNLPAHMRWSQAWMLLALVNLAEVVISNATLPENRNTH